MAMTTYNGEKYLIKQLNSILNQTKKPDEVIICDDLSSDSTVFLVNEFIKENKLNNWQVFVNSENLGYIKNFQNALQKVKGDIIFLCDQDDLWHKDKIKIMSDIMDADQKVKALASAFELIDGDDNIISGKGEEFYKPKCKIGAYEKVNYGKALYYNIAQGCAEALRSDIVKKYCESPSSFILPHDWALNILAYEDESLYFLNQKLISYRIHSNNTTGISDNDASAQKRIPRLKQYENFMADALNLPLNEKQKKEYSAVSKFTSARIEYLKNKKFSLWLKGAFGHLPVFFRYFFFTYLKDLFITVTKKI